MKTFKEICAEPAFPCGEKWLDGHGMEYGKSVANPGLSKLEYFTAMAMQGCAATPYVIAELPGNCIWIAKEQLRALYPDSKDE